MKNFYQLSLWCIMACTLPLTLSCSSDEELSPGPDPDPIIPDNGIVSLSAEGQQADVTIPTAQPWEAESSADWLQLSQMGGKGGENVKIIAARNITRQERIGYIRLSNAAGTRAAADSMQIVVKQPAAESETTGVVLTSACYRDGKVYVKIYNGRSSESSMQQLGTVSGSSFSFTDPDAPYPEKEPIVYIKKGQEYEACPYVILNADGEAKGKFSIAGEASVNTLRVKQNIVYKELGELGNSGSATTHFTDGTTIYMGGGIVEKTNLGYEQTVTTNELRSYDTATGAEKTYADMPVSGQGACWNGTPVIIGDGGIYYLASGKWNLAATHNGEVKAVNISANIVYAVTDTHICAYRLDKDSNGNITATADGKTAHGTTFGESTRATSDGRGSTWLLDDSRHTAYMIDGNKLTAQRCAPADSLASDFCFIGVAGGYIYALSDGSVVRYETGSSNPQPLKMLGTFSWTGETECVDGVLYNFGGLTTFRGTYTASKQLNRFSPSDYAPISVSILPE